MNFENRICPIILFQLFLISLRSARQEFLTFFKSLLQVFKREKWHNLKVDIVVCSSTNPRIGEKLPIKFFHYVNRWKDLKKCCPSLFALFYFSIRFCLFIHAIPNDFWLLFFSFPAGKREKPLKKLGNIRSYWDVWTTIQQLI